MRITIHNWAHEQRVEEVLAAHGLAHNEVREIANSEAALVEALRLSALLWGQGLNVMLGHQHEGGLGIVLYVDTKMFTQR